MTAHCHSQRLSSSWARRSCSGRQHSLTLLLLPQQPAAATTTAPQPGPPTSHSKPIATTTPAWRPSPVPQRKRTHLPLHANPHDGIVQKLVAQVCRGITNKTRQPLGVVLTAPARLQHHPACSCQLLAGQVQACLAAEAPPGPRDCCLWRLVLLTSVRNLQHFAGGLAVSIHELKHFGLQGGQASTFDGSLQARCMHCSCMAV